MFTIVTHENILSKILLGNQYISQNMYKNYKVDLHIYLHPQSLVRKIFDRNARESVADVSYILVLRKRSNGIRK